MASARLLAGAADVPSLPTRLQVVHAAGSNDAVEDALGPLEEAGLLAAVLHGNLWLPASPATVARLVPGLEDLRVGVGSPVPLAEAADAHRTAALALAQATPLAPVVIWEHAVRDGALGLLDPEVADAFSSWFLGGLSDEQVQTLAAFLRHHGSRLQVAIDLGVHRNTVRNRLAAIEATVGRSLDDPATRASAWLALQVRLSR